MQFSGADIIVIAIVLITLVVYRQLDKRNRSLEKVKKYADRVHGELEAHVQEKVVAIKDMGIELEVHQKSAREVLNRVQQIETGLNGRAEDIERIGARIGEYDAALDELVAMTQRAQENINRVREESTYVDTVGKRIRQTQEKLSGVEKNLEDIVERFGEQNAGRLEQVREEVLTGARGEVDTIREDLSGFQERVNQYAEYIKGAESRAQTISDRTRADLEDVAQTVMHRVQEASIQSSEQLTEMREQLETLESDYHGKLLSLAERGENMETEALTKLRERIENGAREVASEIATRLEHQKRSLQERLDTALQDVEKAEAKLAERDRVLESSRAEIDARIAEFTKDLTERVQATTGELHRKILGEIEGRLSEYESQIGYRFEKLEGVTSETEELERQLREAMRQVSDRVTAGFEEFVRQFDASRASDRAKVENEMESVRSEMSNLEGGLTDLKNTAYENVSSKLQVFEDEFFADLKERQTAMERHLVDWEAAFQTELDTAISSGRSERESVEKAYSEELKQQLSQLRGSTYGTYEKIQEDVVAFQKGIELRVADSRELLAGLERQIEEEIQALAADARTGARSEFAEHREQMAAELRELDRSTRQQIEQLAKQLTSDRVELESVVESTRGDASGWKTQIEQRLASTTAEVNQQIADVRVYMGETISDLRDSFAADRDLALSDRDAEREKMHAELNELSGTVIKITDDIRERSGGALEEFEQAYARMKADAEQRAELAETDIEARIREFRGIVQDSRTQFAAMQERMFGKLNEDATTIGSTLQEIDRHQKSFVEQTKVFERADELKLALTDSMNALKADLDRVDAQRKEMRDLESQFGKLRKSADEVSDKMGRFVAEKRRIDALESDYKRLLSMSQAVEVKLDNVTASNDSLQTMQASLRSLEQLEKDVESRFQRLEKKRSILDLTTEGVDKNFQNLTEIETRIGEIGDQLGVVPGKIEELGIRLAQLANNKRDADAAVKQLALLDNTLEEIEERMETLTQAREWLARTETRLEEVQQGAEEQVKLLGALMRQDGASSAKGSAPPVTTRDTVIKLARQSWNVDEIARATSLSRGEVELILELSAK